jgi:hypothetical protein
MHMRSPPKASQSQPAPPLDPREHLEEYFKAQIRLSHLTNIPLDRLEAFLDTLPEEIIDLLYKCMSDPTILAMKGLVIKAGTAGESSTFADDDPRYQALKRLGLEEING